MLISGNEAVVYISYKLNDMLYTYPITPSTSMSETFEKNILENKKNIWNRVPNIEQMQSEVGVIAALYGSLQSGMASTTYTSSQGLLLMQPTMNRIAGELLPTVIHVASRSLSYQGASIFGDHSDVMSLRHSGFAIFCSNNNQEIIDFSLITNVVTYICKIPFIHFFDGFRSSHEITNVELIEDKIINKMFNKKNFNHFYSNMPKNDSPALRGVLLNPDITFQIRESINSNYELLPNVMQKVLDEFFIETGRKYELYEYFGEKNATKLIILMGSASDCVEEAVSIRNKNFKDAGVLKIRLFRPFDFELLISKIPSSIEKIAVLDRTKEIGAVGEPLYEEICSSYMKFYSKNKINHLPIIIQGRYGLSSKEFTPNMALSIFKELEKENPKLTFLIGVSGDKLCLDYSINNNDNSLFEVLFYGLGSEKLISNVKLLSNYIDRNTNLFQQIYFDFDARKSGGLTVSHLRINNKLIKKPYKIYNAKIIFVNHLYFIEKYFLLDKLSKNGIIILNSDLSNEIINEKITNNIKKTISLKNIKIFFIDIKKIVDNEKIDFFEILKSLFIIVLKNNYIDKIDAEIFERLSQLNISVDIFKYIKLLKLDNYKDNTIKKKFRNSKNFLMHSNLGDRIPIHKFSNNSIWKIKHSYEFEKRDYNNYIPSWNSFTCIQCNKCVLHCPHGAIRSKIITREEKKNKFSIFNTTMAYNDKFEYTNNEFFIQVSPDGCVGCNICVEVCPTSLDDEFNVNSLQMIKKESVLLNERKKWNIYKENETQDYSPEILENIKNIQFNDPLFSFSNACPGCGETPYIKLLTQMYGNRLYIANASGCSTVYCGNLPSNPWSKDKNGKSVVWSHSLFENNAEFGYGIKKSLKSKKNEVESLLLNAGFKTVLEKLKKEKSFEKKEELIKKLKNDLKNLNNHHSKILLKLSDYLIEKSLWLIGGDGWAYDINFGGINHLLSKNENLNILILDNEGYANTGGHYSKATPLNAKMKYSLNNNLNKSKNNLGIMALSYSNIYVASICLGADEEHSLKVLREAERFNGTALIIAYSPCITHKYDLKYSIQQQKLVVESGVWPLYSYNPDNLKNNKNPMEISYKYNLSLIEKYLSFEKRFHLKNSEYYMYEEYVVNQYEKLLEVYKYYQKKIGEIDE